MREIEWEQERTERGFRRIDFRDYYGQECHVQASSLAKFERPGTSAIWLGANKSDAMHLSYGQVQALAETLRYWLKKGDLPDKVSVGEHYPVEDQGVLMQVTELHKVDDAKT